MKINVYENHGFYGNNKNQNSGFMIFFLLKQNECTCLFILKTKFFYKNILFLAKSKFQTI